MPKDRPKEFLDAAADAAEATALIADLGATGGVLAGAKLLWTAMEASIGRRRQKLAEKYLERIANGLGGEQTAHLAAELHQDEMSPMWDVIEEGFRAMMGAIHEDAKRAIGALVADYIKLQSLPDREYQMAGGILSALDGELLQTLLVISTEFLEAYNMDPDPPIQQNSIITDDYVVVTSPGVTHPEEVWILRTTRTTDNIHKQQSNGFPKPSNLKATLRLLDRFEFGSLSSDTWSSTEEEINLAAGEAQLYFTRGAEKRIQRLHYCLRYASART